MILELPGLSESQIRKRLSLEEEEALASAAVVPDDDFTETKYLLHGLDLEEQQYAPFRCILGFS